jgi:hypothetical protein
MQGLTGQLTAMMFPGANQNQLGFVHANCVASSATGQAMILSTSSLRYMTEASLSILNGRWVGWFSPFVPKPVATKLFRQTC